MEAECEGNFCHRWTQINTDWEKGNFLPRRRGGAEKKMNKESRKAGTQITADESGWRPKCAAALRFFRPERARENDYGLLARMSGETPPTSSRRGLRKPAWRSHWLISTNV